MTNPPNAYERVVDRLLASPRYGEHRARYWLDAARYADTHGLHFDNYVEMWPYRDWVINAYNDNEHYDQFLTEQLAGDLLPNPTLDQQIASGFVRCNETTNEAGTIEEENLVLYARSHRDGRAGVSGSDGGLRRLPRPQVRSDPAEGLLLPLRVSEQRSDERPGREYQGHAAIHHGAAGGGSDAGVAACHRFRGRLERLLESHRRDGHPDFDRWLTTATADKLREQIPSRDIQLLAPLSEGMGDVTHSIVAGKPRDWAGAGARWGPGEVWPMAMETQRDAAPTLQDVGDFDGHTPYSCAVWAKLPNNNAGGSIVARMTEVDNHRGWDMWVQENHIGGHIVHHWNDDAIKVLSKKAVDPKLWHHFCISYDGKGKASGYKIYIDGEPQETQTEVDNLKGTSHTTVPFKIGQRDHENPIIGLLVQDLRVYSRALSAAEVLQLAKAEKMSSIIAKAGPMRTSAETNDLYAWWLESLDGQSQSISAKLEAMNKELRADSIARGRDAGDEGEANAARCVRAFPRRLRQAARQSRCEHSRLASANAGQYNAQPSGTCAMVGLHGKPLAGGWK